jgi:Na+/melibiose symporter-like transporter
VLIMNDVVRAVALLSIPLAQWLGALSIGQLYAVALLTGVSTVFFDVAYQSYLPQLVGAEHLVEGNAKLTASESVAQLSGPTAGGALVQALTAPYALIVDAASFLWSGAWVAAIRQRPPKPERKPDRHLGREIGEGLRFVLHNRLLRAIATCTASFNLFAQLGGAVMIVLLVRSLHLSPTLIGLLLSSAAVGGVLGSLVADRVVGRLGSGRALVLGALVSAPMGVVAPFVHRDWTLVLFTVVDLIGWGGAIVYNVVQVSFRQSLCPPALLGRMNATMRFLVWGTLPVGGLAGGALGSAIGLRPTLVVAAVGGLLSAVPVALSPLSGMRELPRYVSDGETVGSPTGSVD